MNKKAIKSKQRLICISAVITATIYIDHAFKQAPRCLSLILTNNTEE